MEILHFVSATPAAGLLGKAALPAGDGAALGLIVTSECLPCCGPLGAPTASPSLTA